LEKKISHFRQGKRKEKNFEINWSFYIIKACPQRKILYQNFVQLGDRATKQLQAP
jgi:hypothetical protein